MSAFDDLDEAISIEKTRVRRKGELKRKDKTQKEKEIERIESLCYEFAQEAVRRKLSTETFKTGKVKFHADFQPLFDLFHNLISPPIKGWFVPLYEEERWSESESYSWEVGIVISVEGVVFSGTNSAANEGLGVLREYVYKRSGSSNAIESRLKNMLIKNAVPDLPHSSR